MKNVIEKINGLLENNEVTITEENNIVSITTNDRSTDITIDNEMSSMDIIFCVIDAVKELKLLSDIELVEKTTECTKEQAKYLVSEISKYPKMYNLFLNKLDDICLYDCDSIKVKRVYDYSGDNLIVTAKRLNKNESFYIGDKYYPHYDIYQYGLSLLLNDMTYTKTIY